MSVSVVIPVYNEIENLSRLYASLRPVLEALNLPFEMLFVDDGSTDGSSAELAAMARRDAAVKVVTFRRNYGQTAAMSAGLHLAAGDVIVTMDADLQNDPADIPLLLARLDEGFDLVHGWRKERHDKFLTRRLPSLIANRLIARVTKFPVHDLGCTLKAMRRDIARELHLFGEMHRFIPILAHWHGARCAEIVTRHHPRRFGQSKYGLSRTLRVVLDLFTVKYLIQYLASPMKLFGGIGLASLAVGMTSATATVLMKLFGQVDMTGNPLLMLATSATLAGFQFLVLGMLGELGARIYFEVQRKEPYTIRETHNVDGVLGRAPADRSAHAA